MNTTNQIIGPTIGSPIPTLPVPGTIDEVKPDDIMKLYQSLSDSIQKVNQIIESFNSLSLNHKTVLENVYHDISKGKSRHQIRDNTDFSLSELDEGELQIVDKGAGARQLQTRVNGVVRYTTLT